MEGEKRAGCEDWIIRDATRDPGAARRDVLKG